MHVVFDLRRVRVGGDDLRHAFGLHHPDLEAAGGLEIRVMEAECVPQVIAAHSNSPQIEYHVHWMDNGSRRYMPGLGRRFRRMRGDVARLTYATGGEGRLCSDW